MKTAKVHLITMVAILTAALLTASRQPAAAGEHAGAAGKSAAATARMELKIRSAKVANDGSLQLDFTATDGKGRAVTGLTRRDIAEVSFGRLGYQDEVGLRNVTGKPEKIWLNYFDKSRDGGMAGNRVVAGLGDRERLRDNGDGSYTLLVGNPARLLTRFTYSATAETGVVLRVERSNGMQGSDAYYWVPARGKRIEAPELTARGGGRTVERRSDSGVGPGRQARL